jgi:hypothetical protein
LENAPVGVLDVQLSEPLRWYVPVGTSLAMIALSIPRGRAVPALIVGVAFIGLWLLSRMCVVTLRDGELEIESYWKTRFVSLSDVIEVVRAREIVTVRFKCERGGASAISFVARGGELGGARAVVELLQRVCEIE